MKHVRDSIEFGWRSILIGGGATLPMDLWALLLQRFGVPSLNFALLGRWLHVSIATAAPVRAEVLIGWGAHYAIGISFSALLLATFGLDWARSPTLGPALFLGIVTALAPLLVLQPALGAGIASSKTPRPVCNGLKSLATHGVFGVGLFVAARAMALLLP